MPELTPITEEQALKLKVFRLVMNDTAAAEKAIAFISGSSLNFELFQDAYARSHTEPTAVASTEKAIREAKESLDLFA